MEGEYRPTLRSWSSSEPSIMRETGKEWDIGYGGTEFLQKTKQNKKKARVSQEGISVWGIRERSIV